MRTVRGATRRSPTAPSSDFAECTRDLVDQHYPKSEQIRVVMDNLSTHTPGALYETFEPAEARRILRRLEFHYTPKHASWLNMVEIEIGVMVSQCVDRRIPTKAMLVSEVKAWNRRRNRERARIKWLFTLERASEREARTNLSAVGPVDCQSSRSLITGHILCVEVLVLCAGAVRTHLGRVRAGSSHLFERSRFTGIQERG